MNKFGILAEVVEKIVLALFAAKFRKKMKNCHWRADSCSASVCIACENDTKSVFFQWK